MTLTRRALLLIFPVILISNLLVALYVYQVQRSAISDAEVERFSSRLTGLANSFVSDAEFTRNLVFMMLSGNTVRSFVREENAEYKVGGLGLQVQAAIDFFSRASSPFVSFAITRSDMTVAYYYESSDDPFAKMRPEQWAVARKLLSGTVGSSDDFVPAVSGNLLIHSQLIDARTFDAPIATQRGSAFIIQAAVRATQFQSLKDAMEGDYGTSIELVEGSALPVDVGVLVRPLNGDLFIRSYIPERYLGAKLRPLKEVLAAGSIGLSVVSVGVLLFLIRRNVTGPIATLDRQVNEVIEGGRERIEARNQAGEIGHLTQNIKIMHDETLRVLRHVQKVSLTDSLTGISNRPHFRQVGNEWMELVHKGDGPLALLFIDLDRFKYVNDTFGHSAGDSVLKTFVIKTQALVSEMEQYNDGALLARLAGDEFAVLLRSDLKRAEIVAGRIVDQFTDGLEAEGRRYPVSASIGISVAPMHGETLDDVISCADIAMYHAKASGKHRYAVFSGSLAAARAS